MVLLGAKEYLYFSALARPTSRYWLVLLLGTGWSFFSVLAGPPQYWLVLLGTGWSSSVLAGPARYWLVPSSHLSEPTIQREVSLKPGAIPNSVRPVVLSVSGLAR